MVSSYLIKDGGDHGLFLRSVTDAPPNKTLPDLNSSVNAAPNNNISNHSDTEDNVEAKELYDLLNKIIALILQAINHVGSNKYDFPKYKLSTNKTETESSTITSPSPVYSSASSLVTTSIILPTTGLTSVQSSTQQVTSTHSAKQLREASFDNLFRENAIGENKDIKEELTGVNNLDVKNILPRSYADSLDDKTLEEKDLKTNTNSFLIDGHSNLVDSVNKEKEQGSANIQRLSDNLKEISNIFPANSPVPKKTRDAVFEETPKLIDSLSQNLADTDSLYESEKDDGESNLENQPDLYDTKQYRLRNDEKVVIGHNRKNRSMDSYHEERNLFPLKRVEKNARKKKSHKKIMNSEDKNGKKVNNSNLCESNGMMEGDAMQTFVCSFTFEINSRKSENLPNKKKNKRLINGLRKTRLKKKSKDEPQRLPIKEDRKTHHFLEESNSLNSVREERTMKLSNQETPQVRHEYLNMNYEDTDEAQTREQNNLSNTRFVKDTDERGDKEENSYYEDEKQKNLETNREENSLHKEHFRNVNAMKKHSSKSNKDRRQNSMQMHRLNNMAAAQNEQDLRQSQSRPGLNDGKSSENRKRNHTGKKDEMEADFEPADFNKNELNDMNLDAVVEKKQVKDAKALTAEMDGRNEESSEYNRRTVEFHKNFKNGELEENVPKELARGFKNDYHETDGSDTKVNEYEEEDEGEEEDVEEETEEDKGHHDEVEQHHDEYARRRSSLKKSKEELETLNAEYYDK